jgi:cytochrome P450
MSSQLATAVTMSVERTQPFDPPPALGEWREERPLRPLRYPDGHVGWIATSYALVRQILADRRFSSSSELTRVPVVRAGAEPFFGRPALPGWLVDMDPPRHTRIRRILAGYFTEQRAARLEQEISAVVSSGLDRMGRLGPPVDLVQNFAIPVPALVISELLGVPESERAEFWRLSATLFSLTATADEAEQAMATLNQMLGTVIRQRQQKPASDLLSALVRSDLTYDELVGLGVLLLTAGHDSISGMIGLGTYLLLSEPDQLGLIRSGSCSMPNAVDEMLRYLTVFQFGIPRAALEDVVLFGQRIRAGQCVTLSLPAANRDPAFFGNADELDFRRLARGHLAFGHGIHKCIGQHLARLELRLCYQGIFSRFSTLHLAVPAERIEMSIDSGRYGVRHLPVAW